MNYLTIAGHLGADPEVRFTTSGKKVITMRVATRSRKGSTDETIWWRVTIWGEQFDKMMPYLKKGSPVVVCGEMQKPELFTDREGKPQISLNMTAHSVQFSPFGKSDKSSQESAAPAATAAMMGDSQASYSMAGAQQGKAPSSGEETPDDEVPF